MRTRWVKVKNEQEFANLFNSRVQIGREKYNEKSPVYFVKEFQQRCPRNCCYDSVVEVLTQEERIEEIKEEMRDMAYLLREAREQK